MKKTFEQKTAVVLKSMEQDRQKLLMRQPFIGMILMHLELVPMPGEVVHTACTDGARIMMGIPFYAKLDQQERLFVMAHEAWHCVLMHGVRCQTRNQHRFNIAADLEVHFVLQKEKMKETFVLPHNPAWAGLSAEEIYEKLEHKPPKRDPGKQSEHINGKKNGEGFDEHIYNEGNAVEKMNGHKPLKRSPGKQSEHINGKENDEGFDNQIYDGGNSANNNENENASNDDMGICTLPAGQTMAWDKQDVERMRRIIIQAAQVMERTQGHLPAHIQGIVEKFRKPELPWRELLRQYVTSCYGGSRRWLPPDRRYVSRGLYLPSYRDNRLNAVMAIDTSGSTTGDLPQFFAELSRLLNSLGKYDLTVIQCDSTIQHVETFSDAKRFPHNYQWKSFGHGGTSFVPPFEYIQEHGLSPHIFVYLTDGFGKSPVQTPRYPVLWILTHDGKKPAAWGQAIRLKKDTAEGKIC